MTWRLAGSDIVTGNEPPDVVAVRELIQEALQAPNSGATSYVAEREGVSHAIKLIPGDSHLGPRLRLALRVVVEADPLVAGYISDLGGTPPDDPKVEYLDVGGDIPLTQDPD